MTAIDPRPDTTGDADHAADHAAEAVVWRRLVANYRQAWADYDRLPRQVAPLRLLKARAAVAGTRLALFAYLDLRAREETTP